MSELVARHERSLMRVAQHWSLCRDDALDAYQRALEIYVRRLDSLDPATEIAWLKVVVKHEALAVRRSRAEAVPAGDVDLDSQVAEAQRPVDDLLAGRERVKRSAEALRRLKPDEAKALMLKAQGLSYAEIGESLGWTYTKVNRCITEGRARFLRIYAEIEAGEECDRFAPTLAALVGGTATAEALLELRPHIRNCATCRATVRRLHATRLGRLAALWPLPALVAPLRWVTGRVRDRGSRPEDLIAPGRSSPSGATDIDDLVATAPSSPDGATDLAAPLDAPRHDGSLRIDDVIAPLDAPARPRLAELALQRSGEGIASIKQHMTSAYYRALDPTPLAGVRPGAAAAAVAGCLALGGGTTYCVTTGADPIGGIAEVVAPAPEPKRDEPSRKRRARQSHAAVTPEPTAAATPLATPSAEPAEPAEPSPQPTPTATPRPTPEPTPPPAPEEEYEPVAPAAAAGVDPPAAPSPVRTPAPAPADGPGEFDGP